jgi:hypothetical protein
MKRDAKGQFPKGASGNPRGRPKVGLSMAELAREHGPEMLGVLVKAARKGSITAAQAVLDRGYGRPPAAVDLRVLMDRKLNELTGEELRALEERLTSMGLNEGGEN